MTDELKVSVNLINDKVQFTGSARTNPDIVCDYFPPLGDGQGYTGLELLLMSLAVCSATSIVFLLRNMKKSVGDFNVNARGVRRDVHPTSFKNIFLDFILTSEDADEQAVERAIQLSEESYCPVWAMVKNNVDITTTFKILKP